MSAASRDRPASVCVSAGVGLVIACAGLFVVACSRQPRTPDEPPKQVVAWRTVGSWSGHGNRQTESFTSDSGALRIHWSTTREEPGGAAAFRVTAHSAISGRLLQEAVDHRGAGSGTAYVNQEPHVFYLLVESDHVDWTLSAEEAVAVPAPEGGPLAAANSPRNRPGSARRALCYPLGSVLSVGHGPEGFFLCWGFER